MGQEAYFSRRLYHIVVNLKKGVIFHRRIEHVTYVRVLRLLWGYSAQAF